MAGSISPNIVTDGLILYLDAANTRSYSGVGSTWSDLTKFGNNGSLLNSPNFNTSNGGSIQFDGSNQYCTVPHTNLFQNNSNISLSIWFNFSSLPVNSHSLINKGSQGSATRNYYWLYYNQGGTTPTQNLRWEVGGGTGINDRVSVIYNWLPSINTWYNVVATFEPNLAKLYLNGNLVASTITTVVSAAGNDPTWPLAIAYYPIGSLYYFPGRINLPTFYTKTLSATEVLQNFNTKKSRFEL